MSIPSPSCYGYIYRTIHIPSGDTYIGQHRPKPHESWLSYLGSGLRITRLLRHHPREAVQKELLAEANTQDELDALEKHHIQEERARGQVTLNIADGGRGVGSEALQALWTPELRARQRETLKRLWRDPEHRARLLEASRRYHATEASGKAQAQSMTRLWQDPPLHPKSPPVPPRPGDKTAAPAHATGGKAHARGPRKGRSGRTPDPPPAASRGAQATPAHLRSMPRRRPHTTPHSRRGSHHHRASSRRLHHKEKHSPGAPAITS